MEYNIDQCPIVAVQLRQAGRTNCQARGENYHKCPVAVFQRIISGQWTLVLLWLLRQGAKADTALAAAGARG